MGLAVTAVLVEIASIPPYLAATAIINTQTSTWLVALAPLIVYCLVMITPALVLTAARLLARRAVEGSLRRFGAWLTKHARSTTMWIIGIAGFFLAATAIHDLGWFAP